MQLRRESLLSLIVTFFSPLIGAVLSLLTYKRGHEKNLFVSLSLFAFAVTYFIPPLQDLYRRYTLNYLPYSENTTYNLLKLIHLNGLTGPQLLNKDILL